MFSCGEYVVYGAGEICCVDDIVERCFDGVHKNKYYKIVPREFRNSSYYVPAENAENEIRRVMTKEEILALIDSIPQTEGVWFSDKNERKLRFEKVLRSDDFSDIVGMIKAIHEERCKRTSDGKKLIAADERAFTTAEHIIHGEFAFVLGIKEEDVPEFIRQRIEQAAP